MKKIILKSEHSDNWAITLVATSLSIIFKGETM